MNNQITVGDPLVDKITGQMNRIKHDSERRRNYMKYELDLMDARSDGIAIGLAEGKKQGLEKGRQQTILAAAKMLLNLKLNHQETMEQLMKTYRLTQAEAKEYLENALNN